MALTTKRIIALPSQTDPQEGDYLAIDNAQGGTKKIPVGRIGVEVDDTLTEQGKAADAKAVGDALDEIRSQIEVTGTASGAIATFTDGAEMPAKSVVVNIEPKQAGSGTPSPENVRQISGWDSVNVGVSGINQFDGEMENGYWDTTTGDFVVAGNWQGCKNYIRIDASKAYFMYGDASVTSSYGAMLFYDRNKSYLGSQSGAKNTTFTPIADACYMTFYISNSYIGKEVGINYPSTFTTYEPYTGTTTTVNLGRTVYGGTLDVVRGALTVTKGYRLFDSSVPCYNVTTNYGTGYNRALYDTLESEAKRGLDIPILSDKFSHTNASALGLYKANINNNGILCLGVPDTITTTAEMQAWAGQNQFVIVYELATPQTIQLTPTEVNTLLGENNVWADSGDVEVVYIRDLNIAINNLLNSNGTRSLGMMAMSAPTETTAEEPTDEQSDEQGDEDMR